eukprot:GHVL01032367.1.p3 GENE.GHVL01032367.1~~GHVL01032367.1.p3  ORF type:complete len:208 (-),score=40.34 GHVL01032367.1:3842-4465(-)
MIVKKIINKKRVKILCIFFAGIMFLKSTYADSLINSDKKKIWMIEVVLLKPSISEANRENWGHFVRYRDQTYIDIYRFQDYLTENSLTDLLDKYIAIECDERGFQSQQFDALRSDAKFTCIANHAWYQYITKQKKNISLNEEGYGGIGLQQVSSNLFQVDFTYELENDELSACIVKKSFRMKPNDWYYVDHPRLAVLMKVVQAKIED